MREKWVKMAERHLWRCSSWLPGPTWVSVSMQGASIRHYTVIGSLKENPALRFSLSEQTILEYRTDHSQPTMATKFKSEHYQVGSVCPISTCMHTSGSWSHLCPHIHSSIIKWLLPLLAWIWTSFYWIIPLLPPTPHLTCQNSIPIALCCHCMLKWIFWYTKPTLSLWWRDIIGIWQVTKSQPTVYVWMAKCGVKLCSTCLYLSMCDLLFWIRILIYI